MSGTEAQTKHFSRTWLLVGVLVAAATGALGFALGRMSGGGPDGGGADNGKARAVAETPGARDILPTLVTKPADVVLPSERAIAARAAIKAGDYAAAEKMGADVLARSQLQPWQFYPFNLFFDGMDYGVDDDFLDRLDEWLKKDEGSAFAHLVRAQYYATLGWSVRGTAYAAQVPAAKMELSQHYIDMAVADARKAIQLDSENPFGYFLLLRVHAARGNTPTTENAFQRAIEKFPAYYPLYRLRLMSLVPKSGGSLDDMRDFVEKYAGNTPENSPFRMLYIELYGMLVDISASTCSSKGDEELETCIANAMEAAVDAKLIKQVDSAFELYHKTNSVQFSLAVLPALKGIVRKEGAGHYAGVILQLAANHMDTQLQLMDNNPGKNNFALDYAAANFWFIAQHFANAETKWREALLDIDNTEFADPTEKFEAIAEIYGGLSDAYDKIGKYEKDIAYQEAVLAIRGRPLSRDGHLRCFAYQKLDRLEDAVRACTDSLRFGPDIDTYFWRARAYERLRQLDAALQDYLIVADTGNTYLGASAAIHISVIHGDRKDPAALLASLNSYPFLFDEQSQTRENLSIAFNNRCYAKMQLGRLREALDDCTVSLKYGSLPDAYQKYQELKRRLEPSGAKSQ